MSPSLHWGWTLQYIIHQFAPAAPQPRLIPNSGCSQLPGCLAQAMVLVRHMLRQREGAQCSLPPCWTLLGLPAPWLTREAVTGLEICRTRSLRPPHGHQLLATAALEHASQVGGIAFLCNMMASVGSGIQVTNSLWKAGLLGGSYGIRRHRA